MTLDRKDYKSAIPQLEKRLSAVEQVGEKGLANFDVLQDLLEKEIHERERQYLKQDTSINTITVKMYYIVKDAGITPTTDDVGWSETMPKLDYSNDDKVLWYMSKTFRNGAVIETSTPQQVQLMDGVFAFINSVADADNNWTTIDGGKISTGRIQDNINGDNYFDLDSGEFNFQDSNGNYVRQVGNGVEINGKLTVGSFDTLQLGGRNLLRGTATLANGNSGWSSGHWRASGTGGTIAYAQTITNPPVTGVKGITITPTSANTQVGFVQDSVPLSKREITQSVWVKGKSGDKIDLQPIWSGTLGQEEYGSQRYTLEDSNWHKLTYTKTPNYDHSSVSAGYVYLYAVDTSGARQFIAPQLEYGNKCSDWSNAKEDVDADVSSASKVATNYLSVISGTTGISVHDANDTSNFANLNSNGMTVYKGGTQVATFGDTATIGKTSSINTVVDSSGMAIKDNSTNLATFKSRIVGSWSSDSGTTIEASNAIGIYPNSSYSANKGLTMKYESGGDVIFNFNDRLQFTPQPTIVAKSNNANISLTANTAKKVPLTYIDVEHSNSLDGNIKLMDIDTGSVVFNELDGIPVEVTASVYVLPTASTPAHIFLYYYNGSDGTTTEVGAGTAYLTTFGGAVQLCSRVISPIFGGDNDKLYISVRCASATGTAYCNHKDTFLTVKYV